MGIEKIDFSPLSVFVKELGDCLIIKDVKDKSSFKLLLTHENIKISSIVIDSKTKYKNNEIIEYVNVVSFDTVKKYQGYRYGKVLFMTLYDFLASCNCYHYITGVYANGDPKLAKYYKELGCMINTNDFRFTRML